jgi:hypothetical protein
VSRYDERWRSIGTGGRHHFIASVELFAACAELQDCEEEYVLFLHWRCAYVSMTGSLDPMIR